MITADSIIQRKACVADMYEINKHLSGIDRREFGDHTTALRAVRVNCSKPHLYGPFSYFCPETNNLICIFGGVDLGANGISPWAAFANSKHYSIATEHVKDRIRDELIRLEMLAEGRQIWGVFKTKNKPCRKFLQSIGMTISKCDDQMDYFQLLPITMA